GEPELRARGRRARLPFARVLRGERLALRAARTLARLVAVAVVGAEGGSELHAMAGARERIHEEPGYAPIARRRAVRRRLKRCVVRDPHARARDRSARRGARNWPQRRTRRARAPARRRRARAGARGCGRALPGRLRAPG